MALAGRERTIFRLLWTVVSLATALPIVGTVLGDAAWNGVNAIMITYLVVSVGSFLGLFLGMFAALFQRKLLTWITCISGLAIAVMSVMLSYGFVFRRAHEVPLTDSLYVAGLHAPTLVFYGAAFICSSIEALLYRPLTRRMTTV